MKPFLFDEFDTKSAAAWKQKIQVDLKGLDYNDTLLWKTEEDIVVKPFYTAADRKALPIDLPTSPFAVCQTIFVDDEKIANSLALDALERGANALQFIADKKFDCVALLKKIDLEATKLFFKLHFLDEKFVEKLSKITALATPFFQIDILGNLAESAASIINNILFDENDKLKFGLNYQLGENNAEYETNDELGVTMTTKLSDDILINGKLGVPIGGVTESVIAGDFEIELKLNEDRTLTMKIFNRENSIRYLGEQIGYTQGIGLSYKVEFNSFKKLVNKLLSNPN